MRSVLKDVWCGRLGRMPRVCVWVLSGVGVLGAMACESGDCKDGVRECEENVSKTCVGGEWRIVACGGHVPICDTKYGCRAEGVLCGNGVLDQGEECDGADLGGKWCGDVISGLAGELSCTADCRLDISGCRVPGCVEGERACSGDNGGTLACEGGIQQFVPCGAGERCVARVGAEPRCEDRVCDDGIVCRGASAGSTVELLEVCVSNVLIKREYCRHSEGKICNARQGECVSYVCRDAEVTCHILEGRSVRAVCRDNVWAYEACEDGMACTADERTGAVSCQNRVCDEGLSCDGNILAACHQNNLHYSDCETLGQICRGGACISEP